MMVTLDPRDDRTQKAKAQITLIPTAPPITHSHCRKVRVMELLVSFRKFGCGVCQQLSNMSRLAGIQMDD